MRNREIIAGDMLHWALDRDGNEGAAGVTVFEIIGLLAGYLMQCPRCGAEAWVNIDCPVCDIMAPMERGEMP